MSESLRKVSCEKTATGFCSVSRRVNSSKLALILRQFYCRMVLVIDIVIMRKIPQTT